MIRSPVYRIFMPRLGVVWNDPSDDPHPPEHKGRAQCFFSAAERATLAGRRPRRLTGGCFMKIRDILRHKGSDVATVRPEATVRDLLATLAEHNIGAVVVSPDGA